MPQHRWAEGTMLWAELETRLVLPGMLKDPAKATFSTHGVA